MGLKQQDIASAANAKEPVIWKDKKKLHPYHGVRILFQSLPEGSVVCIDGGEAGGWALQCLNEARASLSMVTTGYLGFLGNGFGYSLGKPRDIRGSVILPSKLLIIRLPGQVRLWRPRTS